MKSILLFKTDVIVDRKENFGMGFSKIIRSIFIVLVLGKDVSSMTLQTEDVVVNLQEDNSIILNCTYHKDAGDYIPVGNIRWQKQIEGIFKDIAVFSHPGGLEPFIQEDMEPLYKHRTELIAPNTTLAAVMIIKDPVCHDKGIYRCQIKYLLGSADKIQTSVAVVEFSAKAQKPDEFLVFPNDDLKENQSISLMCSAEVGGPRGNISIWKIPQNSDTPKLIYTSNSTNATTENCTGIINVTTTYTVTKEDNGAVFRCSSQNNLTQGQGPSKESSRIIVIYGPSNTKIQASFFDSGAIIGDHVNMECISDGNPNPNYTWKFNFTDVVSDTKYIFSANKSKLSFTITNTTDGGYYQCVASIYFKGKWFNSSSNVTLTVKEKEADSSFIQPCSVNPCLLIENCMMKNGSENCSINIWSVIAFLFIALTFILCTTTISLVLSRNKQQKKDNLKKGFNIGVVQVSYTRETFEDFGGYADPKDVKRPEKGQIKSENDGRDNPYADPVDFQTQYAVVQKNWETPTKSSNDINSSNPPNLLNKTDSSNTGNPSSPSETRNPKNSSSDEKTPGSTETSETIPKPPNVDQSPTNYINLLLE